MEHGLKTPVQAEGDERGLFVGGEADGGAGEGYFEVGGSGGGGSAGPQSANLRASQFGGWLQAVGRPRGHQHVRVCTRATPFPQYPRPPKAV